MTNDRKITIPNKDEVEASYKRARSLIQGYATESLVQNDTIYPTWIEGTDSFWYQRALKIGKEYRLVDARSFTNTIAFDHGALARALSLVSKIEVSQFELPISHIEITMSPLIICFCAFEKRWQFEAKNMNCFEIESANISIKETLSPDGAFVAFTRDHNLWVRSRLSGEERALTQDGEIDFAYGADSCAWGMLHPIEQSAIWSPDSKRLLFVRRDKRQVKTLPLVNHIPHDGSIRPTLEQIKVAYPGDQHIETYQPLMVDLVSGRISMANYPAMYSSSSEYLGFLNKIIWWAPDSRRAYFIDLRHGDQVLRFIEFDTDTSATRVLFEEISDTYINILPDISGCHLHRMLSGSNELIWWSERSGWGHLYLYDLNTGDLKHAITQGNWRVRDVLHVDEVRREVWVQTSARVAHRDPYYRDICRINIDSGKLVTLFSSNNEAVVHYQGSWPVNGRQAKGLACAVTCGVSPSANYFVATKSRADKVPVTLLMDRDGKQLLELEVANISLLPEGWVWPEPVKLLASDGNTDIYGLIFRPSDFSNKRSYPVLNYIVSSPCLSVVPKGSFHNSRGYIDRHYFYGSALAELGFIVVFIDGCGTPLRSKTFQDKSYGWIPDSANQDDHIGGLQQLAARYPYMDLDRVGVFTNGYCSALQGFLERQDFYKVCVTLSLLDTRLVGRTVEGDKYEGCDPPDHSMRYPEHLAANLKGKLLLMHAMSSVLSASYPPAAVFRVVDALQKANKNFDMLIVPNGEFMYTSYMMRRAWDYLVKHLQDVEAPETFELGEIAI